MWREISVVRRAPNGGTDEDAVLEESPTLPRHICGVREGGGRVTVGIRHSRTSCTRGRDDGFDWLPCDGGQRIARGQGALLPGSVE
jgi:hypothetical protein